MDVTATVTCEPLGAPERGRARRAYRTRSGHSQAVLAALAGVSRQTVRRAEQGAPLHESACRALASALGVRAGDYLDPT